MFTETARHYDAFYDAAGKDYARESAELLARIADRAPQARTLLDVACGTGRHLEHLSRELRCTGTDLDPRLLEIAAERCPDVPLIQADMLELDLGETFDVVTCLFSAIGYVRQPQRLERAVAAMADHLVPGGLLIVEPSFRPDRWESGRVDALFVDTPELKAARINSTAREGDVAVLDMHYLIGAEGDVDHAHERHEVGLFSEEQYRRAFAQAGLEVEVEEHGLIGRGLLIGTRRP